MHAMTSPARRNAFVVLLTSLLLGACGGPQLPQQQTATFSVTFNAESDPGQPLEGVVVKANGREVGRSDAFGLVQTMLRGPEGAGVQITHECPEGYTQPTDPQTLRLHSFRSLDQSARGGLSMALPCVPTERRVAFVVRTNGKADIPVRINGEEVARTNAAGFAYVVRNSAPGATFRVSLDASGQPDLRPQNPPAQQFTLGSRDDVFVLSQQFEVEAPRAAPRRRRRPRQEPIRIIRIN
ncbi:MAG: hypothetical protein H6723_08200 [Sandaracinus sp.]|nr:hypothetical protein [Sandaracinus sp.]